MNINQSIPVFEEIFENSKDITKNKDYEGHFICNSIEKIFILQKNIYETLTRSNI
jgi:hypothetical protein